MTHTDNQVKEALNIVLQAFVDGSPVLKDYQLELGGDAQTKVNAIVYLQNIKDGFTTE